MNLREETLTAPQTRALAILREHQPLMPRDFARLMWPDSEAWDKPTRGAGNHLGGMGATMPMKGARMLWTLQRLRLARQDHNWLWRAHPRSTSTPTDTDH